MSDDEVSGMCNEVDEAEAALLRVRLAIAELDAMSTERLKEESRESTQVKDRRRSNLLKAARAPSDAGEPDYDLRYLANRLHAWMSRRAH